MWLVLLSSTSEFARMYPGAYAEMTGNTTL